MSPLPMMPGAPPPGMPPQGGPPPGGPSLAALLPLLQQAQGPQAGPPMGGGRGLEGLMPFAAGIGFQSLLQNITKFIKTMTSVGARQEKPGRVPMQGAAGPMDQMAARQLMAQQQAPPMPPQGPANIPLGMPPMMMR